MWEPSPFLYRWPCCRTALVRGVQSCRSRRTWHRSIRGFPGTWEIPSSPPAFFRHLRRGSPNPKHSRPATLASWGGGSERQAAPRSTAKRRQRSAAGRTAGSRSALIVPTKRGNGATRTAGREARRRIVDPLEGKTAHASECESRVNETTTASNAGDAVAADGLHF